MPLPPADEVHLHALDLARAPAKLADLLPSSDLRRAEQRGAWWANARAGLRALLASYLDQDPATLRLHEEDKPRLDPPAPLRFNLSHSNDVALIAVATEREVGVDVEEVHRDRDVDRISRRMLLSGEQAAIHEAADKQLAFFRHWVAKEAFVKATGRGIGSLRSFEVSLDGPGGPRLVHVANDPQEARRWSLALLEVAEPYVAALAFEGDAKVAPIKLFEP